MCITITLDPSSPSLQPSAALSAWPDLRNHRDLPLEFVDHLTICIKALSKSSATTKTGTSASSCFRVSTQKVEESNQFIYGSKNPPTRGALGISNVCIIWKPMWQPSMLVGKVASCPETECLQSPRKCCVPPSEHPGAGSKKVEASRLSRLGRVLCKWVCQWHLWQYEETRNIHLVVEWGPVDLSPQDS